MKKTRKKISSPRPLTPAQESQLLAAGWVPPDPQSEEERAAEAIEVFTDPTSPEYDPKFTAELESMGFDRQKWLRGEECPFIERGLN